MAEGKQEDTSVLTCLEAICRMCKNTKRRINVVLSKVEPEMLKIPWVKLQPMQWLYVIELTGEKMMTLVWTAKQTFDIVFDGTRLPKGHSLKVPIRYWYFNQRGVLKGIYRNFKFQHVEKNIPPSLPEVSSLTMALSHCTTLSKVIPPETHPIDHKELEKVIISLGIKNVAVSLVVSWKPFCDIPWYKYVEGKFLHVHAYRNSRNEIQYAVLNTPYGKNPTLQTAEPLPQPTIELSDSNFLSSNNRKSSISLMESGLNLALRLNVITEQEFLDTSYLQSLMNGYLFCNMENCNTVTCICYVDFESNYSVLIQSDSDWNDMFSFMEKRVTRLMAARKESLAVILAKLQHHGTKPINSKFKKCYDELLAYTKRVRIYTYDSDDSVMHALKLPWANYLKALKGKQFSSITMRTTKDNNLIGLTYRNMSIVNFGSILSLEHHSNMNGSHLNLWIGLEEWKPLTKEFNMLDSCPFVYHEDPQRYCYEFALSLLHGFQNFAGHLLGQFKLDINTFKYLSLPGLSNSIFWHVYLYMSPNGFLVHPIERSLAHNDTILRQFCQGGFTFSAREEIQCGQPLSVEESTTAESLLNLDINSSYGFAASTMQAPGGFGSTWKYGKRQETSQRYRFFEFRAVFYTIYKWQTAHSTSKQLTAAYHNYSPLGVFMIGKYPIDLVGLFDDGSMELIQMDGAYCHGCMNPECKSLETYIDGKSRKECEDRTLERNEEIIRWIDGQENISFQIVTDCCNPEYSPKSLGIYFKIIPELAQLVEGYSSIDGKIHENMDPNITFLAIAHVTCFEKNKTDGFPGPLYIDSKKMAWQGKILLTKDYFVYLSNHFRLSIDLIEWAVFYKRDHVFSQTYQYLLEQKNSHSAAISKWYKSIINLSCGYFGSNPNTKTVRFIRLTDKVPRNFTFHKYNILTINEYGEQSSYGSNVNYHKNFNNLFIVRTFSSHVQTMNQSTKNNLQSLPLFATVIEFGKMRLNQIFHFYSTHIPKKNLKLMYAHIDSTIIAISTKTLKEAAYDPEEFEKIWHQEYHNPTQKLPGQLHTEFHYDSSYKWKFVTPTLCSWSIHTEDEKLKNFKMPGISQKTQLDMYQRQCNLLHLGTTVIPVKRRKSKLTGNQQIEIEFKYSKK